MDWDRNVGTQGSPETYLHSRTVDLLYDEMVRPSTEDTGVDARFPVGDTVDLRTGVAKTKIPGEWDQVGGTYPT